MIHILKLLRTSSINLIKSFNFQKISANFGAFLYGIALGWSNGVNDDIVDRQDFKFYVSAYHFAWIVALMPLGGACSSAFCGVMRKHIGTKITVFIYGIPMVVGYGLLLFAVNVEMVRIIDNKNKSDHKHVLIIYS